MVRDTCSIWHYEQPLHAGSDCQAPPCDVSEGLSASASNLENCLYIDGSIVGADMVERVMSFYEEAQLILNLADMKLKKWS